MNARELVWDLLTDVNERGALSHEAYAEAMAKADPEGAERALVTRLFNGTLERQSTIDAVIERQTGRPVSKLKPKIRNLLRMSVYQMLFLQRVPAAAACNEAVSLAKKHGLAGLSGFVNGTLRGLDRAITGAGGQQEFLQAMAEPMEETERLCFLYSVPEWIVSLVRKDFPKADAERIFQAFLSESGVNVRVNKSRGTIGELRAMLEAEGAEPQPGVLDNCLRIVGSGNPASYAAYREGRFSIQDVSAVLAGNLLPLRAGMKVLDLCAAPGGKTVHAVDELAALAVADASAPAFEVESRDISEGKLALIREQLTRVGLTSVHVSAADASVYDPSMEEWADVVIADVPCSGLGVIGRKPDIKYKTKPGDIAALAEIQREIARQAVRYVKPGGYLAYSTCTVARSENEDTAMFIESLGMIPVSLAEQLPEALRESCGRQGGLDGIGVQIFPEPERWDGFYIAGFRKPE
ncbi:MAG: 16S rRNA (cytosine(967)-C(5))-methyltransferase RsmB [Lachnospiraceae bacterium]|nr:16S rRNA (cytosine(967)-C(5))-methyltransferase RsmB [Lachnospiraceae bacterium]